MNDATPYEKGEGIVSLGMGTGLTPKIDSVSDNGNISFSNKLILAPNVYAGVQGAVKGRLNFRANLNLPYIIGGFGLKAGIQYSFLPKKSRFNFAVGVDAGFVASKDSIKIFGSKMGVNPYTKGLTNADGFMAFTLNINQDVRFTLSPRYSLQYFWIRDNMYYDQSYSFKQNVLGLSAGLKYKSLYTELTALKMNNRIYPIIGIGYIREF